MHHQEDDLREEEDYQDSNRGIVLFLLEVILSLLVVLELNLDLVNVFDEGELYVGDFVSLDNLTEFLQEIQLSRFCFKLSNKHSDRHDFSLEVFFFKLKEGFESLLVSALSVVGHQQQEAVGEGAKA